MIPEAILFDLDDTILSDDVVSEEAWKEACDRFAEKVKACGSGELFDRINAVRMAFWSDPMNLREGTRNLYKSRLTIVKTAFRELGIENEAFARQIVTLYQNAKWGLLRLYPNAEETIMALKRKGIKLALLTNGEAESQRAKVEKFALARHFPVCLIEGEIGYGKPDPRVFQMALDRLQVRPERTWMVGDRLEFDIAGAQSLGIFAIWSDYTSRGLPVSSEIVPNGIIHDISELLTLVERKELC